jgi:hypothetical protein
MTAFGSYVDTILNQIRLTGDCVSEYRIVQVVNQYSGGAGICRKNLL